MVQSIKRVAIIGAGVSGVSATAHLKASGLDVTLFERTSTAGGVWVHDPRVPPEPAYPSLKASVAETAYHGDGEFEKGQELAVTHAPPGPCYELLQNNVPTAMMKLTLNSWPPGTEQIVRHNILAEYIQDTAAKTGVNEVAHYNTKVEHVSKQGDHWKVQTSTLKPGEVNKTKKDWEFDAVIVASGHYHAPKVPAIPGLKEWKGAFPSRVQHSKRYRSARGFENQTVLLIGGSTSSVDIAKELEGIAKKSYQSTRNGTFDHPESMLPPSATRIPEVASFSLKQHEAIAANAPIPGTVTLVDGQILTDIDRVVVATGYHCTFPFLSQYHNDALKPTEADEKVLVTDGLQMHNLHKDIFYIPDPTLAFIGVPYYTATFSLFEFQAQTVAAVYSGQAQLPSKAEQRTEYNRRIEEKGYGRTFHSLRGQDAEYANELRAWINPGIVAAGGKPVEGHTNEWHEQFALLREKFKSLGLPVQFEPKGDAGKQSVQVLSESVEAIEVH